MRVLVLNAGSSSLKASLLDGGRREPLARGSVAWGSDASRLAGREESVAALLEQLGSSGVPRRSIEAVGHRFVHGGPRFRAPVVVDEAILAALEELTHLAPLHNGVALDTMRAARRQLAKVPHACAFDTGVHQTLAPEAFMYALPWSWYEQWGVRRYGFHGLSVEWSVRRAAEILGRAIDELSLVVAHLGSGCSVTAVQAGRSVSTSMGLTPLEGLMMGTRAGSLDPGILLEVLRRGRLSVDEVAEALDHQSGLLGVSGLSGDVRDLERAAAGGDRRAELALAMFVRRAAEGIAAAAISVDRLDCLVFTGGIGENSGRLRAEIVRRLAVLRLPEVPTEETGEDRVLAASGDRPAVLRVEAREDLVIAQAVEALIGAS